MSSKNLYYCGPVSGRDLVPVQESELVVERAISKRAWEEYHAQGMGNWHTHERILERRGFSWAEIACLLMDALTREEENYSLLSQRLEDALADLDQADLDLAEAKATGKSWEFKAECWRKDALFFGHGGHLPGCSKLVQDPDGNWIESEYICDCTAVLDED